MGTALAVSYEGDTTQALVDRSLALVGALSIGASSQQASSSSSKASAKGGKPDDGTQNGGVDNQITGARNAGNVMARISFPAATANTTVSAPKATPEKRVASSTEPRVVNQQRQSQPQAN